MNKLTKLLSVFVIAGAVGTGAAFAAGCGHKHTFSGELTNNDPEGHYYAATCEHTGEKTGFGEHEDEKINATEAAGKDYLCDVCGYDMATHVTSVVVSLGEKSLKVGETLDLTAVVTPENATFKTVTWTSDKTDVATVDANGKVTAKKEGTAVITATADGKSDKCTVKVTKAGTVTPEPGTEIKVSFNLNGHGTGTIDDAVADKDGKITAPAEPTDAEWKFLGWTLEGEEEVLNLTTATFDEATTLYAKWEKKQEGEEPVTKYSVTYVINGHGVQPTKVENVTALPEKLPELTAEGWTLEGWYLDAEFKTKATAGAAITENTTLYANWTEKQQGEQPVNKYSITYVINGHGVQPTNVEEATALPAELPVLSEEGWTFIGWYTDASFETAAVAGATLTESATLYAKWEQNYAIVYDNDYRTETEVQAGNAASSDKGVYEDLNDQTKSDTYGVTISDGKVVVKDNVASKTVNAYIRCDAIELKKVKVEVSVTHTDANASGGWTFLRLLDKDGRTVIALRTDSDKNVAVHDDSDFIKDTTVKAYTAGQPITATIELDFINGKATVTVLGTELGKDIDITATSFGGVRLMTAGGTRNITLNSLVVSAKDAALADVQRIFGGRLDAEYAKYATTHTENATLVETAYNTGKNAINAEDATAASIAEAYSTAVAAMADVISDADMSVEATATNSAFNKALAEINAEKAKRTLGDITIGDETILSNAEKVAEINLTLDKVSITTHTALKEWKESKLAQITAIHDDNTVIAEVKEMISGNVDAIVAAAKLDLDDDDQKATTEASLDDMGASIKASVTAEVVGANKTAQAVITKLLEINDGAQAKINKVVADATKDLPTLVTEYTQDLTDYASGKLTAESEEALATAVNAARDAAIAALSAETTTKANIASVLQSGKNSIDAAVEAYEAAKEFAAAKQTAKDDLNSYIDTEYAKLVNPEAKDDMFADIAYTDIDNATTDDELTTAINKITGEINKVITAFKAKMFTVTVEYDGVAYSAVAKQYGTKLTVADIKITGFTVTGAEIDGTAIPADGVDVYDDITVTVTGIQQGNGEYTKTATWTSTTQVAKDTEATAIPADSLTINNDLFTVLLSSGAKYLSKDCHNGTGKNGPNVVKALAIGSDSFNDFIIVSNVSGSSNNEDNPLVIRAVAALSELKVWTNCSDTTAGTVRAGKTYYKIDDGAVTEANATNSGIVTITDIPAGAEVKIWMENTSSSGGTMKLGKIEATLDENASVPKTVNVTWTGVEGTHSYRYNEEITAPSPAGLAAGQTYYWYYMDVDGETEVKFTDGQTLASGNYTFTAQIDNVTVGSITITNTETELTIGGSLDLTAEVKDDNNEVVDLAVEWSLNGYAHAEIDGNGKLTLKDTATADDTITITAKIGDVESDSITITVKAVQFVPDSIDTTSHSAKGNLNLTSKEGYFTITSTTGFEAKNTRGDLGANALLAGGGKRDLTFTASNNVSSMTVTFTIAICGDKNVNSSSAGSTAKFTSSEGVSISVQKQVSSVWTDVAEESGEVGTAGISITTEQGSILRKVTVTLTAGQTLTLTEINNNRIAIGADITAVVTPKA